jgi:hypothetical protein
LQRVNKTLLDHQNLPPSPGHDATMAVRLTKPSNDLLYAISQLDGDQFSPALMLPRIYNFICGGVPAASLVQCPLRTRSAKVTNQSDATDGHNTTAPAAKTAHSSNPTARERNNARSSEWRALADWLVRAEDFHVCVFIGPSCLDVAILHCVAHASTFLPRLPYDGNLGHEKVHHTHTHMN